MSLSHKNGIALNTLSALNGVTSISAYNGIAASIGGGPAPNPDILWWPLNDAAGTTIAATVGPGSTGSTGTLNGNYFATTSADAAFQSDSAVTWGTNVVTVSFWLQRAAWTDSGAILRSCFVNAVPRWEILFEAGWIRCGLTGATGGLWARSYQPFALNTWTLLTFVLDNSTELGNSALYVNGSLYAWEEGASDKTGTANFTADQLSVKSIFSATTQFYMDDLRIYSTALSGSDISNIFAAGRP